MRDQDVCEPTPCGLLPARPCADGWLKVHDDDHPLWEALDDDDECDDALVLAPAQWVELEDWALRLMQKEGLGDQLLLGLRTGSLSAKLQLHQRACLLAAEWLLSGRLVLVYEVCLRADRNVPWEASFDRNVPLEARLACADAAKDRVVRRGSICSPGFGGVNLHGTVTFVDGKNAAAL